MSYHFAMGAINKTTNKYEYPRIANKCNKYKCPSCEKDIIFKNGKIKKPHFAHYKSNSPCYYYDKPNETQIHKDAKLLMKSLLDRKTNISIHRSCKFCEQRSFCDDYGGFYYDIFDIDYNDDTKAIIEYKFIFNNSKKSADVALVENNKIKVIFEICYKNKTREENRPEPWVEIDAEYLINKINSGENIDEYGNITIECIRDYKCDECIEYEEIEKMNMKLYYEKLKQEQIEKEKQEKERNEYFIKEQERIWCEKIEREKELKLIKEKEEKERQCCKCNIMIMNICKCENPKYELIKITNNIFCINCDKWKCRCK